MFYVDKNDNINLIDAKNIKGNINRFMLKLFAINEFIFLYHFKF